MLYWTAGIHLKQNKCKFMLPEVEYLGHIISAAGLKPSQSKVEAIEEAPVPTNVSELKSFLGLVAESCQLPSTVVSVAEQKHKMDVDEKAGYDISSY